MRTGGHRVVFGVVAFVLVAAGTVVAGWRTGWPPALFGSSPTERLGPHIQVTQLDAMSATPYRVGTDEYVNSLAAWQSLPPTKQATLVEQLHVAERRFTALGRGVFPSTGSIAVQAAISGRWTGPGQSAVLLAERSGGASGYVAEDFGSTAFGASPSITGRRRMRARPGCSSGPLARAQPLHSRARPR